MKQIDYQDPRPIYEQISEYYKTLIWKGIMEPDEQMPSVRQLAMECSTNPNTVQRAYTELERQGFIYTVKGRGNFVKGGQNLLEERKAELARRMLDTIREAESLGIPRQELVQTMQALEAAEHDSAAGTADMRPATDKVADLHTEAERVAATGIADTHAAADKTTGAHAAAEPSSGERADAGTGSAAETPREGVAQ